MIRKTLPLTQLATFCVEFPDVSNHDIPSPIGTGFFVSPDGWFLTAAHVVTENNNPGGMVRSDVNKAWLMKEGSPGAMCQGVSFGYIFPKLDIALLKVDFIANSKRVWLNGQSGFPYLKVSSRELVEGEPVYAFGYPLSNSFIVLPQAVMGFTALCPRVTSAIVSSTVAKTKMVMSSADTKIYVLDKALNYGNSGGPIIATETGCVHALCSRFQPVLVPQPHIKDAQGKDMIIGIPSLYGIVTSLNNQELLEQLKFLNVPIVNRNYSGHFVRRRKFDTLKAFFSKLVESQFWVKIGFRRG